MPLESPIILQETTFSVLNEVSSCVKRHRLQLSFVQFQRIKEIIIETISEGVWCDLNQWMGQA